MHIVAYHHGTTQNSHLSVEERARTRQRLLRKTIWWDIGLWIVYIIPGTLAYWYAPVISRYPVFFWLFPANNSPWELLKLLFWPAFLLAGIRYLCTGQLQKGILATYARGLCCMMGTYLTGYYLINGLWGQPIPLLALFLFWVNATALILYLRRKATDQKQGNLIGALLLLLLAFLFIWFTLHPPAIGLFIE